MKKLPWVSVEAINSSAIPVRYTDELESMVMNMIEEEAGMLKFIGNGRRPQIAFQSLATSFPPDTSILLLVCGKTVVGFSSCYNQGNDRRVIELIYIKPEFRKNGYGNVLMNHMLINAPSIIEVSVLTNNEAALRLYEKHGFFKTIVTLSRVM